jgi:DNA (cytosine-5)-methyltransferase 1
VKVLDLFSGIGGFSLGLERAGMETVAFCEFDKHAQKVLKKHWPDIPIHEDVRTLDGTQYRGSVDVVCGGFPCQDLSHAGNQKGFDGSRSTLYSEMLRIIGECKPRYAIFENVSGLLTGEAGKWFAKFLFDLAQVGYDAEWHCIEAGYVGAPHRRDRVWIVAYHTLEHDGPHNEIKVERQESKFRESPSKAKVFANANVQRCEGFAVLSNNIKQQIESLRSSEVFRRGFNLTESPLLGANDGVSRGMDRKRIARLGNAVVPQIPEIIGRAIMEIES